MEAITDNEHIALADKVDILELEERIKKFREGLIDEERFKLYRLTRGVYGQRQLGVQMFRIKIPFGRLNSEQLIRIADVSDKYATGNLHITTRQDIQLHYVKLEDSSEVWKELAAKKITAREACGNTVRNVTASAEAGIDPHEPFDVSPYAHAVAHYFMRNPICQEMGRKIKISFSSSEKDSALSFIHDFGFIPKINKGQRGFKILVGGGLGAQAMLARTAYEFLPEKEIIAFLEAALRIFDRYGEREKRHKARLKFLIKKIGLDAFLKLVSDEKQGLSPESFQISITDLSDAPPPEIFQPEVDEVKNVDKYRTWLKTNTFVQKQSNYRGVYIKVHLGDLSSEKARYLARIVRKYASDDIRLSINQNILLKYIRPEYLPELFTVLDGYGFAQPGYDSIADITACPGTDTCNLGVTNSTALSTELERLLENEYSSLLEEQHIKIKISGCMNACGQHMIGNIGFHGSSIKKNDKVIPAMQVVLGGGVDPQGHGYIADKILKVPTKRIPDVVRTLLDHFEKEGFENEYFNNFYTRLGGRKYFYNLLKIYTDVDSLKESDLIDWGEDHLYNQQIGVGECAGVILDVIGTIINDAKEKLEKAQKELQNLSSGAAIYYAYSSFVTGAKAALLSEDIHCNTHIKIISDFQEYILEAGKMSLPYNFQQLVLSINTSPPDQRFAEIYTKEAEQFLQTVINWRNQQQAPENLSKPVITSYYNA